MDKPEQPWGGPGLSKEASRPFCAGEKRREARPDASGHLRERGRPPVRKRGLKPLPGRVRRLPRRPSETAGALHLKEHGGRRLLMPPAAPFREVQQTAGVNAGPGTCACELGM